MHAPVSPCRPRRATRRGETLVMMLVGMAVGALVIGGLVTFFINARHVASDTTDATKQEAAGLTVLNRIAEDISNASAVALADNSQLVLDLPDDATNSITRVGYVMDASGSVYKVTRANAPATFDPTNPGWGPASARKTLATDARAAADGSPFFTYIDAKAGKIGAANLPAYNPGLAATVKRVDIAFAAHTGSGARGYVELRTSAALNSGPGGAVDPNVPACPLPIFTQGDPFPIITWNMTGQTTKFEIRRNGVLVETQKASTATETYKYSDQSLIGTTTPVDYQVTAVGAGGSSPGCASLRWYPRLVAPNATATLQAAATESSAWPASGYTQATVQLSWSPVTYAMGYEVYRRPLDNTSPYGATGSYQRVGLIASGTTTSFSDYIGWDTAYEYRVVANGPMPEASLPSASMRVLAHTKAPTQVTVDPVDYNKNRITWTQDPGPTATGYAVYRRDVTGCFPAESAWKKISGATPLSLDQNSFTDTTAPLSSRLEYAVGAYNSGPRGGTATVQYASKFSGTDQALQFPANPTTNASGSFTSPGGPGRANLTTGYTAFNVGVANVSWSSPCPSTTDTYRLDLYGSSRSTPYGSRDMGSQTSWKDPGWFGRATERNYKAVAYNATGSSPNADTSAGVVGAYQYPNQPATPTSSYYNNSYSTVYTYTTPTAADGTCVYDPYYTYSFRLHNDGHPTDKSHFIDANGTRETAAIWPNPHDVYNKDANARWSCDRYTGAYTINYNTGSADDGDSGNRFCSSGRGSCTFVVYYTLTDPSGAATQMTATVAPGSSSFTGYFYNNVLSPQGTYKVAVDGMIACNAGGCASSQAATTCSGICSPPAAGTEALTAPAFQVVGSDTNNDTVPDAVGTNRVAWNAVPGATGYYVYRYTTYSGGSISTGTRTLASSAAGSCSTSTGYKYCFYDTGRAAGTETYYKVAAYNASGTVESASLLAGYQAPTTTNTLTNLWMPTKDDQTIAWSWTKTADGGMGAAGKFCASAQNRSRGNCSYQLVGYDTLNGNTVARTWDLGADVDNGAVPQPWGTSYKYAVAVCNKGGCRSTMNNTVSPTWPGPFDLKGENSDPEQYGNLWFADALQETDRTTQTDTVFWSNSKGATQYKAGFVEKGGDPFDRTWPAGYIDGDRTSAAPLGTDQTTGPRRVTPGARYTYTVWAGAPNGKWRQSDPWVLLAEPPRPMFAELGRFCKAGDAALNSRGWKTGYRVHTGGTATDWGGTGVTRDLPLDRVRWAWWIGTVDQNSWNSGTGARAAFGLDALQRTRLQDNGNPNNWTAPENWSNSTEYYDNQWDYSGWVGDDTVHNFLIGFSDDDKIIPWRPRTQASVQFQGWVDPSTYTFDVGQYESPAESFHLATDGTVSGCPAGGTSWVWNGVSGGMGRWANKDAGGYFVGPSTAGFGVTR